MASTYSKLKIELIGTGDQAGQWGTTTNNNLGSSSAGVYRGLEQAIVGMATISSGFVANSYTLPYTNSNDDQEFRCLVLNITASLSNPSDLIVPAIQKPYIVINSSGQTVTVKVSGQTGVAVPNGAKILLYNTGTDVGTAVTYLTELKLGGNLTMPSAGSINDSNGNELIKFPSAVASAVNELTISNAATGSAPTLSATGGDTNIGITLTPKGTGTLFTAGNVSFNGGTFVFNESGADKDFRIEGDTDANLFFTDASTDRVGIGTSSPRALLDLNTTRSVKAYWGTSGTLGETQSTAADYFANNLFVSAEIAGTMTYTKTTNDSGNAILQDFDRGITFYTGVTGAITTTGTLNSFERMRLNSSGNLGLGVTPSAWGSTTFAIDIGSGSALWNPGSGTQTQLLNNSFNNGTNFIYKNSSSAARYRMTGAQHEWYTAPSGTANTAITFTQAMTLNASGNLGVGTTSPETKLVAVQTLQGNDVATGAELLMTTSTATNDRLNLNFSMNGIQGRARAAIGAVALDATGGNNCGLAFYTRSANDGSVLATTDERARITSGGDFGIGTTSPSSILDVQKAGTAASTTDLLELTNSGNAASMTNTGTGILFNQFYYDATTPAVADAGRIAVKTEGNWTSTTSTQDAYMTFETALDGTVAERARITSGGDLLVGTTSTTNAHILQTATSGVYNTQFVSSTSSSPYGSNIRYTGAAPNGTGNEFLVCNDTGATRLTVRSNGGIANYSANDVNLSDRREKTNFAPAKSYLDTICAIPVQTFNYIDQSENDPGLTLGVVAQDVQAVAPELVMESNWGTKDEPKMRLSVYQTDLQYALMKCIQEQQAIITSLAARVAALEGTQP